jgi:hypothetical protein
MYVYHDAQFRECEVANLVYHFPVEKEIIYFMQFGEA